MTKAADLEAGAKGSAPPSAAGSDGPGGAPEHMERRTLIALLGPMVTMLVAMLDNFVVSTSMPRIVGELGGMEHLAWVATAYILASTVSAPIYGKLGDLFGRKNLFLGAIVVFLVGSALSGLAGSMPELIAFRALQGLGAGGLIVNVMAIVGDLVPPRDRGKFQGYMAIVMALATIGGPLAGGLITDQLSWRWVFYINLPIGAIAIAMTALTLHLPKRGRTKPSIDYLGAGLIAIGATALVLLLTWGGTEYDWISWQIIGLGAVTAVATALLLVVESRVTEPMIPLWLFKDRNFSASVALGGLTGLTMFGSLMFLPMYQQTVQGASATNSGLLLLPMMIPVLIVSPIAGRLISRTGSYKIWLVVGGALLMTGFGLLTQLGVGTSPVTSGIYMALIGAGMGMFMQLTMTITQNSAPMSAMGVASSSATFFRTIGGSLGTALFGGVFAGRLADSLPGMASAGQGGAATGIDPAKLGQLPPDVHEAVIGGVAHAIQGVFWTGVPFAVAAFVLCLLIKEVPLRTANT